MILSILWRYKAFILIGLLLLSTYHYKSRYDDMLKAYDDYKLKQQVLYDAAVERNEQIELKSKQAIANVIANNEKQLLDVGLDRKRETAKLKGSINEISNSLTIANDAISLRNSSTSNDAMLKVPEAASGITYISPDSYRTVIDACKVTTHDYNALHDSWTNACLVHGCE